MTTYTKLTWANLPATTTPLSAANLQHMEDGIESRVGSVSGVNPDSSGNVAVTKADVGLSNVDNTSDVNKPVSTAQTAAFVPNARSITAGTGLSGGGDLSANRTLSVAADTTTQKIEIAKAGTLTGTRKRLNFIEGTNVTITTADDSGSNEVDVTIASSGGGGVADIVNGGSLGSTASLNVNSNAYTQYKATLTSSCALTISNIPSGGWVVLEILQDATGGRTLTVNSISIPLDTAANAANAILVFSPDGSTLWVTGQRGPAGPTGPTGPAPSGLWAPASSLENFHRATRIDGQATLSTGRLWLFGGIVIPAGHTVSSITFVSSTTAAVTPTNQWFALVDQSLNVLAKTTDDTTTAWAASTPKTLSLSSPYTPVSEIPVYVGCMVAAATVPNLSGVSAAAAINGIVPQLSIASTTSLTTPASLGGTAASGVSGNSIAWCYTT